MDDLVSRQAVIDAVMNLWDDKPFRNPALVEIIDCIKAPPSIQAERKTGRWTPCDKKLPDKRGYYLTSWGGHYVGITEWTGKGWMRTSITDGHITERPKIDAWMERPEPYRK